MNLLKKCFLLVILISLGGCSKEPIPQLVTGDWLWEGSSGGIGGMVIKPQPSERVVLHLSDDGRFSVHKNDTLVYYGTFKLLQARSIYSGKDEIKIETKQILTNHQLNYRNIIVINGIMTTLSSTRLSIGDNTYDGFGSSYVKN